MLAQRSLSLEDAQRVINAVVEYARSKNWRIAVVSGRSHGRVDRVRADGRSRATFSQGSPAQGVYGGCLRNGHQRVMKFWKRQEDDGHRGPATGTIRC